jgi:hypothetical protein
LSLISANRSGNCSSNCGSDAVQGLVGFVAAEYSAALEICDGIFAFTFLALSLPAGKRHQETLSPIEHASEF